jgi:LAS superfamily LD-carboxypeptidase LdcB
MADKIEYPRENPEDVSNADKEPIKEEKRAFMACEIYLLPASTIQLNQREEIFGIQEVSALAKKYHVYLYTNSIADLLVELSNTEKTDSIYADPSALKGGGSSTGPQTEPGADTSDQTCPSEPGITDAGIQQTYNPGKTPKNKIRLCDVQGIKVNVSVASNLNKMVDAAKGAGLSLTGGGFRTYDEQKALRIAHGCADDSLPASSCSPPTAQPGRSNHEQGEAIDFINCSSGSPIFNWLSAHAAEYGFKNLPSESWHWSRTGN